LPGTGSFVGEFLILTGSYLTNSIITFIGATGMVLATASSSHWPVELAKDAITQP